jgi:UDP-glucose 4-epimerase
LGRHVLKQIGSYALDNLDPRCGGDGTVARIDCDVTNYVELERAILDGEFSHIIHLAAYGRNLTCRDFPQDAWRVNVHGTKHVLMVAHKHPNVVKRVVVCSSNIVLSDQFTEYKLTKKAVEHEIAWYAKLGVSCMGLRPSNIYGAGQSKTEYQPCAFASLDESFRVCGHFLISGDGTQTRDWVHAGDVARAFELAAESTIVGETLDVCTGIQTSMNEVARMLHVPAKYVDPRPGDAKALLSDYREAEEKLHFRAAEVLQDRIWDAFPSVPRGMSA